MADLYPLVIQPRYVERIWGGTNLARLLGKAAPDDEAIGESWEVYEENTVLNGAHQGKTITQLRADLGRDLTGHVDPEQLFPLLTKLIDAQETLSVQVHPDDRFAQQHEGEPYGKTECWYVIHVELGAELIYGFSRASSPEEYRRLVAEGKLDTILRSLPVRPGDVVYLPARTVHAIGAGIVLYELQQTSDLTYRIYDWNRKDAAGQARELHVDKAAQVLDYRAATRGAVQPLQTPDGRCSMLIAGQYFCMELIETVEPLQLSTHNSAVAICSLQQPVRIAAGSAHDGVSLSPYSSLLLPAALGSYTLQSDAKGHSAARALVAYVPLSAESTCSDLLERSFPASNIDRFLAQFAPVTD